MLHVLGAAAYPAAQNQFALGLGESAPYSIRFGDGQRVCAALHQHRACPAHLLGLHLALCAGTAAFTVGMEENGRIDPSAKAFHLPIPNICVGPRQLLWLRHVVNPLAARAVDLRVSEVHQTCRR